MLHPHLIHRLGAERRRDLITEAEHARAAAPARRRRRRALLAAALPAAIAIVALPTTAEAGTAEVSAVTGVLHYGAATGETNNVKVRVVNAGIVIEDTVPITTGRGCRLSNGAALCDTSPGAVIIGLGDRDDTVRYEAPHGGFVSGGDGNDTFIAGRRQAAFGRQIEPVSYSADDRSDRDGFDTIDYGGADRGVSITPDNLPNDGRPGDLENIRDTRSDDFERIVGSGFGDTLFGTPDADRIDGLGGRDIIAAGAGDDIFDSRFRDDDDDYHGGPGRDLINYSDRRQPVRVDLDNVADDGEAGEADLVRSNVENVTGGSGDDTLISLGAFSTLDGRGGNDKLLGGDGPDMLIGASGRDTIEAGNGNDVVLARDSEPDFVDCGTETDSISRDAQESIIDSCETVNVGVLRLAAKAIDAEAGKPARVGLSWRHPDGWRKLRTVTLRLIRDGAAVGDVTIRPRGKRITADGVVKLVRRGTRLTRSGKTVTARLALRIDASLAGQKLGLEVEATDNQGRRQLERDAGTISVAT